MSRSIAKAVALAALVCGLAGEAAYAEEHVVNMRNSNGKGKFMLFDPEVVKAKPGDTVKFVAADKGHNVQTMPEIWPEGVEEVKGAINEEIVITIDKPGIYGIKCMPHYPMGMMALIVAGELVNKAQLDAFKPTGGQVKRLAELIAQLPQ